MTLAASLPRKSAGNDEHSIVSAAARRARMAGVRRTLVDDLESFGTEPLVEDVPNAPGAIVAHGTLDLSAESGCSGALRMAIQTPWAIEKASVSPSAPKSLNFTQNASLKL